MGEHGEIEGQVWADGRLAREVGTEDGLKRAVDRPAGKSRLKESDEWH